jgi:hypothetical protein
MKHSKLYTLLALAGTVPFLACALLPLLGIVEIPILGALDLLAGTYGLAIICFLAGAHWGTYLSGQSASSLNLFVISNAIFLAVWFAFIGASLAWALAVQVIAFLLLLFIDQRLKASGVVTAHYFRIRSVATAIAVVSLLAILLFQ